MPDNIFDIGFITIILQLIFLEGILSFDNAAVLGAMVVPLPIDKPVPWPKWLRPIGHLLDPLLGPQRTAALKVGLLGAYIGRGLMLLLANVVINNPWLQFFGALYLIKIAIEHLGSFHEEDPEVELEALRRKARGFWSTVALVEFMDLAFSLDNVVVAVTLSNHIVVVMIGVALGILTMRFAAGIFASWIEKEPILATGAYLLVLNIGIEFLLSEFFGVEFGELTRFVISVLTLLLVLLYAHWPWAQRVLARPLASVTRFFYYVDKVINLIFYPLGIGFRFVWHTTLQTIQNGRERHQKTVSSKRGA